MYLYTNLAYVIFVINRGMWAKRRLEAEDKGIFRKGSHPTFSIKTSKYIV